VTAGLDIVVRHRLGAFTLDATLRSQGGLTALYGPSGSGKTSLVNVIAGLIRPESGHVRLDGEALFDRAGGVFVPPHRRRIGYVFQEARLFPHLSVRRNLLFGRWFAPRGGTERTDLTAVLDLLGIGHLLARRPGDLSGGERQRVAIGRALLARPRLLLMDEPLASLDEPRKAEILPYIERLRDEAGIPIVYVSHALAEVARLATTVAIVEGGMVTACGPAATTLSRLDLALRPGSAEPSSLIEGRVGAVDPGFGLTQIETRAGMIEVVRTGLRPGETIRIRILASDVMIGLAPVVGISALNQLHGTVAEISATGGPDASTVDLRIDCGGERLAARLTRKSLVTMGLGIGTPVVAIVKSVSVETP
jgi:molybdate transport system ATP-binding protein